MSIRLQHHGNYTTYPRQSWYGQTDFTTDRKQATLSSLLQHVTVLYFLCLLAPIIWQFRRVYRQSSCLLQAAVEKSFHQTPKRGGRWAHLAKHVKAIELTQKFHQSSLDFAVGRRALTESAAPNGINLIHEDDARLVVLGIPKHLSNQSSRLAYVLVHYGTGDYLQEVGINVACNGSRQERLACTTCSLSIIVASLCSLVGCLLLQDSKYGLIACEVSNVQPELFSAVLRRPVKWDSLS